MPAQTAVLDSLNALLFRAAAAPLTGLRLKGWQQVIQWQVEDECHYWRSDGQTLSAARPAQPGFILRCSRPVLERIAAGQLPFFIALWGTGELRFEGSFSDAYRLGYIFLSDKRGRRVIFVSHCWLNTNTRFPEGCAFPGANVPLIQTLLDSGLGIIQMPCPEYEALGLEKQRYGQITGADLRDWFRNSARPVARQIRDYLEAGCEVVGVLGMNPSPSCGVGTAKGKGTMLGTDRDTSEKPVSGVFIEELQKLLDEEGIAPVRFFGVRRLLAGESGLEERIAYLKSQIAA